MECTKEIMHRPYLLYAVRKEGNIHFRHPMLVRMGSYLLIPPIPQSKGRTNIPKGENLYSEKVVFYGENWYYFSLLGLDHLSLERAKKCL